MWSWERFIYGREVLEHRQAAVDTAGRSESCYNALYDILGCWEYSFIGKRESCSESVVEALRIKLGFDTLLVYANLYPSASNKQKNAPIVKGGTGHKFTSNRLKILQLVYSHFLLR